MQPPVVHSLSCGFLRRRVLPLHPHRRVEEPDRRAVHAVDGPHGGQLQGPGLHPGSRGGQRAEPEGERHHLSEPGRPPQGRRAQLRLGWVLLIEHGEVKGQEVKKRVLATLPAAAAVQRPCYSRYGRGRGPNLISGFLFSVRILTLNSEFYSEFQENETISFSKKNLKEKESETYEKKKSELKLFFSHIPYNSNILCFIIYVITNILFYIMYQNMYNIDVFLFF